MKWSVLASLLLVGVIACRSAGAPGQGPNTPSPSVSTPSPTATSIPEPTFSRVILWYLDPLEAWENEHPDPMALSFCEAGLHPWSG